MMVAVLHDVVEDTRISFQDLRKAGYPESVIKALDGLTRRKNESYEQFVERAKSNAVARKVKIADLEDNMDLRRIKNPQPRDLERLERYERAWSILTNRRQ